MFTACLTRLTVGRGPLTVGGPGSLNLLNLPLLRHCAAYTRNRCFCPRTGRTPYESLTGRKSDLSRRSVFGSTCYAFVQDKRKPDPRSAKGVFIGYDHESPAYLVYFKNSGIVKKSRCVRFTNKFDVIESEVVNDQFHDHIDQEHTVT